MRHKYSQISVYIGVELLQYHCGHEQYCVDFSKKGRSGLEVRMRSFSYSYLYPRTVCCPGVPSYSRGGHQGGEKNEPGAFRGGREGRQPSIREICQGALHSEPDAQRQVYAPAI